LRRLLQVSLGVLALAAVDALSALLLEGAGLRFPSSVAGMLLCFGSFLLLRWLAPRLAEQAARLLEPAARFLGRWMALFFVPPLVLLPLTPTPSAADLSRLAVLLGTGFVATLFTTALAARAMGAPGQVASARTAAPAPGWSPLTVIVFWTILGAVALWLGTHASQRGRVVFGIALTIVSFTAGEGLRSRLSSAGFRRFASILHPVLLGAVGTCLLWSALGLPLFEYLTKGPSFGPGNWLMALLSPAVVALGLALDAERRLLRAGALPLLVSTAFAAAFSLFATALAARVLSLPADYARAVIPRSVTTPVALSIAKLLHAEPGLTAVFVISNGVLGALFAAPLLERARLGTPFVLGVATGASSHGIGTAALVRDRPAAAALSGIAFALTAAISVSLVSLPPVRSALWWIVG